MNARILVVDDEATIGHVMRRVLFGYEVSAVTSARDGLERVERGEHFDAVVCDVHMPGMDGLEFAERLAIIAPALAESILFVTGDVEAAKGLAARRVLTIPFDMHTLRSHLEQVVRPTSRPGRRPPSGPAAATQPPMSFSERPTVRPPSGAGRRED
ncbi:MAG TPA: response regulator [Labilithrix sp.]|nr:response regulator [Labilithrix sp.]